MSVVNCKVKYIRPRFNDLKEWMDDPDNIYIGRAEIVFIDGRRFPKSSSNFANPFKIGKDGTRDEVIQKYKNYITEKIKTNNSLKLELVNMKNKNLGCWCAPERCHGYVLLDLIDEYTSSKKSV